MGVATKYVCDKCGHTQDTSVQMWEVGITRRSLDSPSMNAAAARQPPKQLWCRECMVLAHILPCKKGEEEKLPPPPTLEDLVREIVREEMQNA